METEQIKKITKKEILEAGRAGHKIYLVKYYKDLTHSGLLESKCKIEEAEAHNINDTYYRFNLKKLWEIFKPILYPIEGSDNTRVSGDV